MKIYKELFNQITSLENIVTAWEEFRCTTSFFRTTYAGASNLHVFLLIGTANAIQPLTGFFTTFSTAAQAAV
jgi:hypothetical protein